MRHTARCGWLTLIALLVPAAARAEGAAIVANGSFEDADYAGWTLTKDATSASFATSGVLATGETVAYSGWLYDFRDGVDVQQYSSCLPLTGAPTDGDHLAIQLQNGPATTRMYQTVTLPARPVTVSWDLAYHNTWGTFAADQRLRVVLRDPATDAIVATLFETKPGDPLVAPMTHYSVDASDHAGETLRLDVVLDVREHFLATQLDNVRIDGPAPYNGPSSAPPVMDQADPTVRGPADDGSGGGSGGGSGEIDDAAGPAGCSAGGSPGGGALLLGLALAFARRRRA